MFDAPSDTAALLSMRGMNTIVINQWGYTGDTPQVHQLLDDIQQRPISVGEAVQSWRRGTDTKQTSYYDNYNCVVYGLPFLSIQNILK